MSAISNLHSRSAIEKEGRPVLRAARNTDFIVRKALNPSAKSAAGKDYIPSATSTVPNLSKPFSSKPAGKGFPESAQTAVCEKQSQDGEKIPDRERIEDIKKWGTKKPVGGGKAVSTSKASKDGVTKVSSIVGYESTSSTIARSSLKANSSPGFLSPSRKQVDSRTMAAGHARKMVASKAGKVVPDALLRNMTPPTDVKNRCGWITSQSDPAYVVYHDTEWGVPIHNDRMLYELLVLVGAQAEFTWPIILNKRETFRDLFAAFDPAMVAKFDDKKLASLKTARTIIQQDGKVHGIIENANRVLEIQREFGSFDNYLWGFVNHKSTINKYRLSQQVPVKSPKSELISKDLMKRGFRFVGPTVVYSFMQAVGMINDHLVTCFRYNECDIKPLEPQQADKHKKVWEESSSPDEERSSVVAVNAVYSA